MQPHSYIIPQRTDFKSVARALTVVENDLQNAERLLQNLTIDSNIPIIGVTGPPGAGKSTLVNTLISTLPSQGKYIAVLAVDPTSPFNFGSLLGDRIRMMPLFNNPQVYIRSVATRGSLGGLSAKIIEMTDVLRSASFDYIIIETVGVGQSEVEIAGLADTTLVVLVPEAGDEIQNIKSGLMEIADAFIINKADRPGAALFSNKLKKLLTDKHAQTPVFNTVATDSSGIAEVADFLTNRNASHNPRKQYLLAERAYQLIRHRRMASVDKRKLRLQLAEALTNDGFNLYSFVKGY